MYRQIIFNIMKHCFFAVDLGATSGRTILGTFTPQGLELQDVNRFPNHLIEVGGHYYLSLIHISEPTRQAEISYAVFCLKKKKSTRDGLLNRMPTYA